MTAGDQAPNAIPGIIVAAPASGSGKTLITLGLLRALRRRGVAVRGMKAGPDYIDPAFHQAASGQDCFNLDPWGMRADSLSWLAERAVRGADLIVAEGVMGLYDGAADGSGSTADLAAQTGWPVLLVMDVRGQSATAAAVLRGLQAHRNDIAIAGVLLNRCGGERHAGLIEQAFAALPEAPPILGTLPKDPALTVPSRHLGLVQASERDDLDGLIDRAADWIAGHVDLDRLIALAEPAETASRVDDALFPPLGQTLAVARDDAFRFCYDGLLAAWRDQGAEIKPFSPLADHAPDPAADAVYLPGGYPELHAGQIAANQRFLDGLRTAAGRGAAIFGECGGYMVLGESLIDAEGARHAMAGLLPLETSFEKPVRHLGYRRAETRTDSPLGPAGRRFTAHEFHYSVTLREGPGAPLFSAVDATGRPLGETGLVAGTVAGSFLHLIDRAA